MKVGCHQGMMAYEYIMIITIHMKNWKPLNIDKLKGNKI